MNVPALPVSMIAGSGKGASLAIGVIGLLIVLSLASRRDPTVRNQSV